ncbi:MAG: type II toxin-antitoxin system RelE/ParE family toxin [Oligoflexia bacterium]|nr:type II toxin-antitoxin system RelE/ParE family toxin [Oligoflexia bacterium]
MKILHYRIEEYVNERGKCPYRKWLLALDSAIRARIQARIFRFEMGNLGDHKSVGDGVFEARMDFGKGYRVYFGFDEKTIILLLLGGDKSTQNKDIPLAQNYLKDYLENKYAKKK